MGERLTGSIASDSVHRLLHERCEFLRRNPLQPNANANPVWHSTSECHNSA